MFKGYATTCKIKYNGEDIPLRLDLMCHSPAGFSWGYLGSGPSQAAIAILSVYFRKELGMTKKLSGENAVKYHQIFKEMFLATINQDENWELDSGQMNQLMEKVIDKHERLQYHKKDER